MGKIIIVNGHRAFRGWMEVWLSAPCGRIGKSEIYGDWLYEPDTDCWYCDDLQFPAKNCIILEVL